MERCLSFGASMKETLRSVLDQARKLLETDDSIGNELRVFIHRLLQQIQDALDDDAVGASFDFSEASARMWVAFQTAETRSQDSNKRRGWGELWRQIGVALCPAESSKQQASRSRLRPAPSGGPTDAGSPRGSRRSRATRPGSPAATRRARGSRCGCGIRGSRVVRAQPRGSPERVGQPTSGRRREPDPGSRRCRGGPRCRHAGLDRVEFGEPGEEAGFVAHHSGVLGHGVADGALQGAHVLPAIRGEQRRSRRERSARRPPTASAHGARPKGPGEGRTVRHPPDRWPSR